MINTKKSANGFFTAGVKAHFVGIGGIGMCGLAELLHYSGSSVTGSDLVENKQIKRLRALGVTVFLGHKAENIGSAEILIQSSAVPENNIEIQTAKAKQIPVIKRSSALAEVMRLKRGIVVAGTHGKTTTTHLIAHIFIHNKKDPTVVIGGRSHLFQSTALEGKGEWFIAESDESDGGFKSLTPEVALVTNIDKDHLDYYGSFEKLKKAFLSFVLKTPFYGSVVAWGDDKGLRDLLSKIDRKVIFYGFNEDNHFVLKKQNQPGRISMNNLNYHVLVNGKDIGNLQMPLYGSMNALNTVAALAVGMTVGLSFEECKASFKNFKGVDRRFHFKGVAKGVEFYDDYAHHPTEVKALLSAFREKFGVSKKLVVLFQPHRFSRTKDCWQGFLNCFQQADKVFVTDIYPAGESPLVGVSSKSLAKAINKTKGGGAICSYCPEKELLSVLANELKAGDVFVTMGAGSVYKIGEQLLAQLKL